MEKSKVKRSWFLNDDVSTIINVLVKNKKTGVKEEAYQKINMHELEMKTFFGDEGLPVYCVRCKTWRTAKEIPEKEFTRIARVLARFNKACRLATKTGKPVYLDFA